MSTITLKGREIPLLYTSYEMKTVQEEIAPINKAIRLVTGRNPEDADDMSMFGGAEHIGALAAMVRILGNAGLEESGQEPDLTDKWILRHMKPGMIRGYVLCVSAVINLAMKMETGKKQEGPVDEVLEEENRKKEQGN
jgi:hypothetical protein